MYVFQIAQIRSVGMMGVGGVVEPAVSMRVAIKISVPVRLDMQIAMDYGVMVVR
ncbi:MAG: hypothetical protein ACP5KG_06300 [Myxococcota bacterium]